MPLDNELITFLSIASPQIGNGGLCEGISGKTCEQGCQRPTRRGRLGMLAFHIVRQPNPRELMPACKQGDAKDVMQYFQKG